MRKEGKGESLRSIIYERMDILLTLAAKALREGEEKYARRYVFLARKLSSRYNCRFSPRDKARFCKGCGFPLVPGLNASVRLRKRTKSAEYACSCGHVSKLKYAAGAKTGPGSANRQQ